MGKWEARVGEMANAEEERYSCCPHLECTYIPYEQIV